ncbi:MAG: single-stranded DNA-binding protein [Candidatus Taylorbacteria bacterium CG11_big_fil_rev_8_21_14_0_20_46_11]|uniref:Single-stranded DNA-binding protein n=1 Tax=Candidatus Taylorbacteria bacterium CG11_big_fil_rev_8_21_14_0_20_46_11 TaxID=1975025 RepID=A0A2H0KAN3_9BACT|nr:MAG: single-stranded DNA-binding protein [Candidatus Taylorbacteria bacterium CG11_big_fil_rev_8_21_14_0_20_46_11]
MYLNKVILYGNLTRDPELKALPSGSQVAEFAIATNRVYKDKDGSKKEEVDFHNIVSFGKTAEVIAQYLKKGRPIFIEGRIRTRSWESKDGTGKRYKTEIVLEQFQFGPSARDGARGTGGTDRSPSSTPKAEENKEDNGGASGIQYPDEQINADDIPF